MLARLLLIALVLIVGCSKKPKYESGGGSSETIPASSTSQAVKPEMKLDAPIFLSGSAQVGDLFDHPEKYKGKKVTMVMCCNLLDASLGSARGRTVRFRTKANYEALPIQEIDITIPKDLEVPNSAGEYDQLVVTFLFSGELRRFGFKGNLVFSTAESIVRKP